MGRTLVEILRPAPTSPSKEKNQRGIKNRNGFFGFVLMCRSNRLNTPMSRAGFNYAKITLKTG